jgi:succinate dehydrogenase / fumarate reductase cytochrome b subunit
MNRILGNVKDMFLNFNPGMVSFTLQRITGIILVLYMFLHLCVLSNVIKGADFYTRIISMMEEPHIVVLELLLVAAVSFHLFNGIRIVLVDLFGLSKIQDRLLLGALSGCILMVVIYGFAFCLPKLG